MHGAPFRTGPANRTSDYCRHIAGAGQGGASVAAVAHPPRRLLDASRAPISPVAREALLAALDEGWADPRRLHAEGRRARALLDGAREAVATVVGARPDELSFAPSPTLARQLGLLGLLHGRRRVGAHLVVSAVEHSALLHTAQWHPGQTSVVGVDGLGRVDLAAFGAAVAVPGTAAACLQAANAEVGTRQPVAAASDLCGPVPLLVDASGVIGREDPPTAWDVLTADAGAWGGPGIGVLAVRTGVRWRSAGPQDESEQGRVPGEVDVPVVLAAAAGLLDAEARRRDRADVARGLVDRIRRLRVADVIAVGDPDDRLPHVVTLSTPYVDGETLADGLDRRGIAVASGSACTASTLAPSHVLEAMGVLSHGSVRVTLPLDPVAEDVEALCAALPSVMAEAQHPG